MVILSTNQCLQNASIFKTISYHIIFKNAKTVNFQDPVFIHTLSYYPCSTSVEQNTNGTNSKKRSLAVPRKVCMSWGKVTISFVKYIYPVSMMPHDRTIYRSVEEHSIVVQCSTKVKCFSWMVHGLHYTGT